MQVSNHHIFCPTVPSSDLSFSHLLVKPRLLPPRTHSQTNHASPSDDAECRFCRICRPWVSATEQPCPEAVRYRPAPEVWIRTGARAI